MMGDCWIKQELDKFIDANAERSGSVLDYHNRLEWIDYNQLGIIEHTGFGEFYKAHWIEEEIEVRLQYINEKNFHEVLIRINDYLKITDKLNIVRLFGFSLNPETNEYALVIYFENVKFLKQHLMENTLDLDEKLHILSQIVIILKTLSENHISLNLNSQNFLIRTNGLNDDHVMFSIFTGLERGYGIAYTAPEILQDNKRRNDQSSDVYAILYRIIFEQKPYNNYDIINVFRSKFLQDIQDVQHLLEELIRRYQDANPSVCPTLYGLEILSHDKPELQTVFANDVTKAKQNEKIKVNTDVEMKISESANDEINYAKAERKRDDPEVKQKALNERSSGSDGDNNGEADMYDIYKSDTMCVKKAKRKQMESDCENNDITEQNKKTKVNTFELTDDKTNYTKSERKRDDSEVKQKALNERSSESAGNNNGEADIRNIDESNIKKAKRKQIESDCENNDTTKAEQNKKTKVNTVATFELTNYGTNYTRVERKREVKQKLQVKPKPTNKINENAKLPENPASHSRNEIIHNNTITSLARCKNNVNKDYKHVQFATNNIPKAQNDYEKFEKVCEREKENQKVKSKKGEFYSEENDDLDSQKRKVVNSRVESANNDRGNNPKTSKLQVKPKPTNKINENAKLPENPASHNRDEIIHDNTLTSIAGCKNNINKDYKQVQSAVNKSKVQNDREKFDKLRELNNLIKPIRRAYFKDMKSNDPAIRQRATAMYLIDRLVLRVGHERKENEADTVGCCLLRSEHVILESPNIVHFDFLGKDSIRYQKTIKVKDRVYKNLSFFKKSKSEKDKLFDMTNAREVNKFLSLYREGLTAKVFRTYKATVYFQKLLEKYTQVNGTREQKIAAHRRASCKVAKLLNHRRTVFGNPIKRSRGNITRRLSEITIHLREARQPSKNREENVMTPASKTSVRSYIDPRITVAWCHKNKMKVEDVFIRSLRDRFKWALTKENELYEF